jgi:hypothetical protein
VTLTLARLVWYFALAQAQQERVQALQDHCDGVFGRQGEVSRLESMKATPSASQAACFRAVQSDGIHRDMVECEDEATESDTPALAYEYCMQSKGY